jgi:hypothetical protein
MGDQQRPTPSDWQELASKELKGDPSSLTWVTPEGIETMMRGRMRVLRL